MNNLKRPLKHGSLFSGIGGFDLASEWMGWENVFHCEWNEFGQRILKHYWPNAITYHDITKTDFTIHRGTIDILTGGFPCQPYSAAGKRLGKEDDRHLWPEMLRAIRQIQPTWVVGENVLGLVNWNGGLVFDEVQADLEAQGYEVQPYVLPACAVNAPHRRDRVWFVAYSKGNRSHRASSKTSPKVRRQDRGEIKQSSVSSKIWITPNTNSNGVQGCAIDGKASKGIGQGRQGSKKIRDDEFIGGWRNFPQTEPTIRGGNDGLPTELDGITFSKWRNESIKAYGNAVVPQVVHQIFKSIQQYIDSTK